ncbi:thiamine diphosphokinase [Chryseobacterium sp. CKR4-1]|uniref:thiamine diphosphokinase n=1 Tax=Chryseobacterium sp. CKR4-1 TaxID=3068896 RepID=UPI0027966032|nr:thiamine diphosphokinase [Chryseobacterium sp. CKR4-1]MDQ1805322.1 thiamine diphosphokinase [Chryseobacterium sp. CKR4-1]
MKDKVLLFINGEPPMSFPDLSGYDLIACTDGAFHYLKEKRFPLDKLDFISGDFDSHTGSDEEVYQEKFILTLDQDKTDFHKALEIILDKGFRAIDVFGASGGEQDHFLGNLTVAYTFKDRLEIKFYDEFSEYYFIPKDFTVQKVKNRMISIYPFPIVENITTKGLNWPLTNGSLSITSRIGTRNFAVEDEVSVHYESGDLLFFVGRDDIEYPPIY